MRCARCGRELGEEDYSCPECGAYAVRPDLTIFPEPTGPKKNGKKIIAVLLIVILLSAGIIAAVAVSGGSEDKSVTLSLEDGGRLTLSGDFLPGRNILGVSIDDDAISFTLDQDIASGYTYYSWGFFDRDHSAYNERTLTKYSGDTVNKTDPVLFFFTPEAGVYDVSVKCYTGTVNKYKEETSYSGTVRYDTDVTVDHMWRYEGKDYGITTTFAYDVFESYHNKNVNGRWASAKQYASFVTDDPVVRDIAERLKDLYGSASAGDPGFANFVLSYVQNCYKYPSNSTRVNPDEFLYGSLEYFAYPVETVFYGMGDCEDTSILVAAILKVFGYDTAIVILPGHAMIGVALDDYTPKNKIATYEVLSQIVNGKTYYAGETTISYTREFGLSAVSGDGRHPFSYYIDETFNKTSTYGFFVV
jgi:hypothetical protein